MNTNLRLLMIIIVITFSFSCKEKPGSNFEVNGTIENIEKLASQYPTLFRKDSLKVFLYEVPFGNELPPVQLDSAYVTSKNNSFTLSANVQHVGMIDVMLENGPMIPLVNDEKKVTVTIDLDNRDNFYSVKGSPASQQMRDFIMGYSEKSNAAELAFKNLDSLKLRSSSDSVLLGATNQKNSLLEAMNSYSKQFLSTVNHPVVAAFILGTSSATLPINELETELNKQLQKYPSDQNLAFLKKQFDARKAQLAERDANMSQQQQNSWVGKKAPQLTLPDPNGKDISLDAFRGKYVLVDF
ncbi:MAG TPA: DUF4369 domain-containing protein, partial [Flavitalea sp.]|nr:DUF4369 domain-containing protein [Flavitalea sp.]